MHSLRQGGCMVQGAGSRLHASRKQENHIDYEIYRIEHGAALAFANYQPSYQLEKFDGHFG